ncbi:uncharacterized protein K452DRAFT_320163 [Aplosporella prunicola CBS 121167]|uniref:Heterokaryon incompatibility domain-containing protein n=1 Tax=Aplosporella prunicola CBS 121167 TaxID=1176127 RepID=A0A6A6B651_9PEZI|nr:uncharacterized protein K452DRAFT_320163 [Aplosporella prunicola CBS 121167]KAF2139490.1 hypothetical protein K452DRAFT_320163 [Aplosporella prunicola CBS 121167]
MAHGHASSSNLMQTSTSRTHDESRSPENSGIHSDEGDYCDLEKEMFIKHRDASGRVQWISAADKREWYLRPKDGRLAPLKVQGFNQPRHIEASWERTGTPEEETPTIIQLLYWTYASILEERARGTSRAESWIILGLKWLPSCTMMLFMLLIPQNLEGDFRNNGFYDPVRYKDWGYAKTAKNPAENRQQDQNNESDEAEEAPLLHSPPNDGDIELPSYPTENHLLAVRPTEEDDFDTDFDYLPARQFRPRYLCFLNSAAEVADGALECTTWNVSDYIKEHGKNPTTEYIFLSYTRKQFCVATDTELATWNVSDQERARLSALSKEDRATLRHYGTRAARAAGVPAFWLDFECLRENNDGPNDNHDLDDVWRICDIVRAAHSMVILLGPSINDKSEPYSPSSQTCWFHEWGSRLWTLPEILLCPPEHRVSLYTIGVRDGPELLAKRNFATRAWKDAKLVRQLIDHYESSIHLTPLELVSIALECFQVRQTDQRTGGDMSYALMGLLRRRPKVDRTDSGFQAFARLSLSNDSDMLLERLICMLPPRYDAKWYQIRDAWGAHLWDIEPTTQIAGIADDETVILDGAYGATINWKSMRPQAFIKRNTVARKIMKIILRGAPAYFLTGLSFIVAAAITASLAGGSTPTGLFVGGLVVLIPTVAILLLAPVMLHSIYRGKFWSTQGAFIGLEGDVDIGMAERFLFGFNCGRLKWSTNGSVISRHYSLDGECMGKAPSPARAHNSSPTSKRFTLVDTFTMTATAFDADRPPTAVIICGREGGMQRAILCSYDWQAQTFCRETVLRMPTLVLDRMFRIDRFRLALSRTFSELDAGSTVHRLPSGRVSADPNPGMNARFKADLLMLPLMWVIYGLQHQYDNIPDYYDSIYIPSQIGWLVGVWPVVYAMRYFDTKIVFSAGMLLNGCIILLFLISLNTIGIQVLRACEGIAKSVTVPACLLLMQMWYKTEEQTARTVIWATAGPILAAVSLSINYSQKNSASTAWTSIEGTMLLLLAFGTFFLLGTPEQVSWLSRQQAKQVSARVEANMTKSSSRLSRKRHHWPWAQVRTSFLDPQIYFFFMVSLLDALPNGKVAAYLEVLQTESDALRILPSLGWFLIVGVVTTMWQNLRFAFMALSVVLALVGRIVLTLRPGHTTEKGLFFGAWTLIGMGDITQILLWSLFTANISGRVRKAFILCTLFTGYTLGHIITRKVFNDEFTAFAEQARFIPFVASCASVELVLLALWAAWLVWQNKTRAQKVSDMDVSPEESRRLGVLEADDDATDVENVHFRYHY